jgi:site-specific DNA-methyltransferase (adenine-specific)
MKGHGSLDEILCDPELANRFDDIARNLAPGFSSLQYRWGAFTLRKKSKVAGVRAKSFTALSLKEFKERRELRSCVNAQDISNAPGLYLITSGSPQQTKYMYAGSAMDLQTRLRKQFAAAQLDYWEKKHAESISFLYKPEVTDPIDLLAMQRRLIDLAKNPRLNYLGPTAA